MWPHLLQWLPYTLSTWDTWLSHSASGISEAYSGQVGHGGDLLMSKDRSFISGDVAQLVECLPSIHEALGLIPNTP